MSGVFRNIDPPTPPPQRPAWGSPPPPAFGARGGHTRWVETGWGVNSSEDARHCSVLYICKYFVTWSICVGENFLLFLYSLRTQTLASNYDNEQLN
jgi:hypothetical protein